MSSSRELGVAEIEALLAELGRRLQACGARANLYLVGGAAMALTFRARRVTRDIDAIFEPDDVLDAIVGEMAAEHGLPPDWLNTAARPYVPGGDAAATYLELPGLSVATASVEHLLAMKLASFRPQDQADLRMLFQAAAIADAAEAVSRVFAVYGEYAEMFGSREEYLLRAESVLADLGAYPPGQPREAAEG